MYILRIANKNYSSWSLRPWVLMQELEILFEERIAPFSDGSSYAEFRNFSPTGQVPCLIDHDEVVWDSLGITEYLAERHIGVWPTATQARSWARCATAEMHSGFQALRNHCPMSCGIRVRLDARPPALDRDIARLGELWNEGLRRFGGPFLGGRTFSAVDAFFAPVAFRIQTYGLELDEACTAYAERLRALPSMRNWYRDALAESWREPSHEVEIGQTGTWLADLRAAAK